MRRSILTGFGVAAIFMVAACTDSPQQRSPLAPTEPLLAPGTTCSGPKASEISKQQKALNDNGYITAEELAALVLQFDAIKVVCPNALNEVVTYVDLTIGSVDLPAGATLATLLVDHWKAVAAYTGETLNRRKEVLMGDGAIGGVEDGGAAVLLPGESMTTFDNRAQFIAGGTATTPTLYTFDPRPGACAQPFTSGQPFTTLRATGSCYDLKDFPHVAQYTPQATLTLCLPTTLKPVGLVHQRANFGTTDGLGEVLQVPVDPPFFPCGGTEHSALDSWLGRKAGPLGRALAHAYEYLRPRPLFATHGGTSGWIGSGGFSPVGGAQTVDFEDDFNDPADFNDGVDTPDLGQSWTINTTPPGYIQIQDALGNMSGGVVVLSQAQGNCDKKCPTFSLLGTRYPASVSENIGSEAVSWTALQNKPSVKDGPFKVFNANDVEIARLSYVTESDPMIGSQNKLIFKVYGNGTQVTTIEAGFWTQNESQRFTITVNLNTLDPANANRVSLSINGIPVNGAQNIYTPRASSLKTIGYELTGIDAGVIASDDWQVLRLADIPPLPPPSP